MGMGTPLWREKTEDCDHRPVEFSSDNVLGKVVELDITFHKGEQRASSA